jgi:hypothetical protein
MSLAVVMALNTNWMRRTGWSETFASVGRKLLVQLVQILRVTEKDLALGVYKSVPMQYYCETKSARRSLTDAQSQSL